MITTRKIRTTPFYIVALALFASLLLPFSTGCTSKNKLKKNDPLMGDYNPEGQPLPPPPAGDSQASNNVPPLPSATSANSNAQLAHGNSVADTPVLAIGTAKGQVSNTGWKREGIGPDGVKLHHSRPIVEPIPNNNSQPIPLANDDKVVPANALEIQPPVLKVDPWTAELKSRGVSGFRKKNVPGGVQFSAVIVNPQSPNAGHRMYTAIAPTIDEAVQAVLKEIDSNR